MSQNVNEQENVGEYLQTSNTNTVNSYNKSKKNKELEEALMGQKFNRMKMNKEDIDNSLLISNLEFTTKTNKTNQVNTQKFRIEDLNPLGNYPEICIISYR